jgi:tetratricopeptide (TPR) repeat protein
MPDTEQNKRRGIEVRLLILGPMRFLGSPQDSLDVLHQGESLSRELNDERSLALFHGSIGFCHAQTGDGYQAVKYLEQALESAEGQDIELMAPIAALLCACNDWLGDYLKTVNIAPRFISLIENRQMESDWFGAGFNVYVFIVSNYGKSLAGLGNFEEGQAQCEKSVQVASRVNDLNAITYAEFQYGATLITRGDTDSGIPHMEKAIEYCEEVEMVSVLWGAWLTLGIAHLFRGEIETAKTDVEKALRFHLDAGVSGALSLCHIVLGLVHLESGELTKAQSCAQKALEQAQERHEKHWEGLSLMLLGAILGMSDESQFNAARQHILQGMSILEELKVRPNHTLGHLFLGMICAVTGRTGEAVTHLQKARDAFWEMGMDYWLRRTQEALAMVES